MRIGKIASFSTRLPRAHSLGTDVRFSWTAYVEGGGTALQRVKKLARAAAINEDLILTQLQRIRSID